MSRREHKYGRSHRLLAGIVLLLPACAFSQLAAGKLLIATQKSRDPDLKQTVVLLVQYDRDAAVGLIVNRRSEVPVSEVFPELTNAKGGPINLWAGGPLAIGLRALHQSDFQPAEAHEVLAGLSVISNKPLILKLLAAATPPDNFRLYAGYVGWTPQQLRSEIAGGLWLVRSADAGAIFDPNPETLWSRLTAPRAPSVTTGRSPSSDR
jgi:putative transcriptional regulator